MAELIWVNGQKFRCIVNIDGVHFIKHIFKKEK